MQFALTLTSFSLADAERQLIEAALLNYPKITDAAEVLGISRHALVRRLHKLGIPKPNPTTGKILSKEATL